ncbi:MAG: anti-sigma 24 factor [Betaproteobacteria bacterium]|nr:MAG: anti-sigma 24 factor [Betaproteobacteria bacterium]
MKEKLSALIDGELQGNDCQAHLGRLRTDTELRRAWDAYHLIGDALRGHVGADFTDRVVARLQEEPTVLAPQRRKMTAAKRVAWYAMSAAASVAAVTLVVLTASSGWRAEPQLAAGPETGVSGPVTTVAASVSATDAGPLLVGVEVENYLLAHQPYSHISAMQGIVPYARTVADGRRAVRK